MGAELYEESAMKYTANVADGTAVDSAARVSGIFDEMRSSAGQHNIIVGKAVQPPVRESGGAPYRVDGRASDDQSTGRAPDEGPERA
eukprot:389213-Pyramimonas_sp.AAC.1